MADKELTEADKAKLDRLVEVLVEFAEQDDLMDLPMMRLMTAVCRHEGDGPNELTSQIPGYGLSIISRLALDMGTNPIWGRRGQPPLGLIEYTRVGAERHITLTRKGIEFRDRLLALL